MVKFSVLTKILPACCILFACGSEGGKTSEEAAALTVHRFEKELFAADTLNFATAMQSLSAEYPSFFTTHFSNVLGGGSADTAGTYEHVRKLLSNPYIRKVVSDVDSVYPDMKIVGTGLAAALERYRGFFPQQTLPAIFTYPASLSGFQPAVWNSDSVLAIGIDCFLGADYHFYQTTTFPRYITRRFTPAHLLPTALKGYLQYHFPPQQEQGTFLSAMIAEGKILYMLDQLLPESADSLKIGYSHEQMEWAKTYEKEIWAYYIEQDLVYSTVAGRYAKYLDEAPFTVDLGPDSAPRIGAFTGWQIVRKYMEENRSVSPAELMAETDAQRILSLSEYKPR